MKTKVAAAFVRATKSEPAMKSAKVELSASKVKPKVMKLAKADLKAMKSAKVEPSASKAKADPRAMKSAKVEPSASKPTRSAKSEPSKVWLNRSR